MDAQNARRPSRTNPIVGFFMGCMRRIWPRRQKSITPEPTPPDQIDEANGLTRRVRLLRGNDEL